MAATADLQIEASRPALPVETVGSDRAHWLPVGFVRPYLFLAAATLVNQVSWHVDLQGRVFVGGLVLAHLLLFFPLDWRSRTRSLVGGIAMLGIAGLSSRGFPIVVAWAAYQLVSLRDQRLSSALRLQWLFGALVTYAFAVDSGFLWAWDDQVGRFIVPFVGERASLIGTIGCWPVALAVAVIQMSTAPKIQRVWAAAGLKVLIWSSIVVASIATGGAYLLALATGLFASRLIGVHKPSRHDVRFAAASLLTSATFLVFLAYGFRADSPSLPRRVGIAPIGLGTETPLPVGPPKEAGIPYEANFGRLPRFLERQGVEVRHLPSNWSEADLRDLDTVLFINQTKAPSKAQVDALYARIGQGMRLLVAGDHTDIYGVRGPANALLARAGLSLNFDSATPLPAYSEWHDGLWADPSLGKDATVSSRLQISVGASVAGAGMGGCTIVGVKGFSDAADSSKPPGHLGNLMAERTEPLYGVPLIAEADFGRGSVKAFGDTSPFQNAAIVESAAFILRSIGKPGQSLLQRLVIRFSAGVCLVAIFLLGRSHPWGAYALAIAALGTFALEQGAASSPVHPILAGSTVLDGSLNSAHPGHFEDQRSDKFYRLAEYAGMGLLRADLEDAILGKAATIVIDSPTRSPNDRELNELDRYMREGGRVILICGADTRLLARPLLLRYGLHIGSEPLGGFETTEVIAPALAKQVEADLLSAKVADYKGMLQNAYEVGGPGETWVTCLGLAAVKRRPVGNGCLIVIGDGGFLTDKNLGERLTINLPAAILAYEIFRNP